MKFALAQLNFHIGNFEQNAQKIIQSITEAKENKADMVVFPELAISGYPPRDFLDFDHFISQCEDAVEKIAKHCVGITAIVGSPTFNPAPKGKKRFNAAFVLQDGGVKQVHHKMLLPNYDVFDEYRFFEPAKSVFPLEINGQTWAITICEDIWDLNPESIYTQHPLDVLTEEHTLDGIINIASSPFSWKQRAARQDTLNTVFEHYNIPVVYVNQVGAQTELIFDGGSAVVDRHGNIHECAYFTEGLFYWEASKTPSWPAVNEEVVNPTAQIHDALVLGLRDYFSKLGFKKALLGLSGGIDSAVTLVLACEALGAANVLAVKMPSEFSSDHSISDSDALIKNLGCEAYELPIKSTFDSFLNTLAPPFKGTEFGLAEENLQARIRGTLLMSISNKHGHILLNTSNKSETAVGFGTLYGDMCGGLAVIGDVYKEQVYALARYMNRNGEIVPENIITKPPSAELRPGQKDSDRLPDYAVLDAILHCYIEEQMDVNQIKASLPKIDPAIVDKTLRLVNINEYKRYQTPPILRVSPKAFGMGRRMPIVAKYLG